MIKLWNKKIIIINGISKSGKDTFIELLKKNNCNIYYYNIIDICRYIIQQYYPPNFWFDKNDFYRQKLHELKIALENFDDLPYKEVVRTIKSHSDKKIIFICMREEKDIVRLQKDFGAKILLIQNNRIKNIPSNNADQYMYKKYDYLINNNFTLEDLERQALKFYNEINI